MEKVNILGTDYSIINTNENDEPRLIDANGACDFSTKELLFDVDSFNSSNPKCMGDKDALYRKVVRHEIIHAMFNESGLENISRDELLVDWIAIQAPKMLKIFQEVGCLDGE